VQDGEFIDCVDEILFQLEDELDEFEEDLDIDTSGGLLTVKFPNGSTLVLSKQIANHEVWVAAVSGGYHLAMLDEQWYCRTTQESLADLLSRVFSEQLERTVSLLSA